MKPIANGLATLNAYERTRSRLTHVAHKADWLRLRVLLERRPYLDIDTTAETAPDTTTAEFVIGKQIVTARRRRPRRGGRRRGPEHWHCETRKRDRGLCRMAAAPGSRS